MKMMFAMHAYSNSYMIHTKTCQLSNQACTGVWRFQDLQPLIGLHVTDTLPRYKTTSDYGFG